MHLGGSDAKTFAFVRREALTGSKVGGGPCAADLTPNNHQPLNPAAILLYRVTTAQERDQINCLLQRLRQHRLSFRCPIIRLILATGALDHELQGSKRRQVCGAEPIRGSRALLSVRKSKVVTLHTYSLRSSVSVRTLEDLSFCTLYQLSMNTYQTLISSDI